MFSFKCILEESLKDLEKYDEHLFAMRLPKGNEEDSDYWILEMEADSSPPKSGSIKSGYNEETSIAARHLCICCPPGPSGDLNDQYHSSETAAFGLVLLNNLCVLFGGVEVNHVGGPSDSRPQDGSSSTSLEVVKRFVWEADELLVLVVQFQIVMDNWTLIHFHLSRLVLGRISHIHREGNSLARKLANENLTKDSLTIWDQMPNL
ncbi:hypothetical protein IFM89_002884 [Coptis chinensis]|uniref:Uncharacterized protein n=1 Tax=Coptis chinensis TaxID=261450 RepID=A0A835IKL4_9MAGN|nr:hypothetical protein IFM89_002884 [Coptis chinensis]